MKFLSITGPKRDFDRVVNVYLNKYNIHLENALSELNSVHELRPFVEINPHREMLIKADDLMKKVDKQQVYQKKAMTPEQANEIIQSTYLMLEDLDNKKKELKTQIAHYNSLIQQIKPFRTLDYDIHKILEMKFINFRFGKIAHEHYNKMTKYVYENLNTVFMECDNDRDYVWGIYFVPAEHSVKIDAVFASMHFERLYLPDEYQGTPEEACSNYTKNRMQLEQELESIRADIKNRINQRAEDIYNAHKALFDYNENFEVRKLAACTRAKGKDEIFYILCGWIPEAELSAFVEEINTDQDVTCIVDNDNVNTKPPTKLKNIRLFRPFEMFVKMYGLPAYNEIDPTSFVAITYSLLFGIMFGDVGQGLLIAIGGYVLYKVKKMNLAAIISLAGVFSTIFGFVFGSIFGYETILKPLWLSPMHNVMTVLLTAVGFGMFLNITAIVYSIINSIKEKNYGKMLFDTNGISGLVFYVAAIVCVLLFFLGEGLPATIVLVIFFVIPLLLIFMRHPLQHLIEKKKKIFPDDKVMFFVENLFELLEIVLSYVTNSISFLRVGAFALSHAAMMGVVMLLAGAHGENPNYLVIALGNIFVSALEGLIVGIQVLRLEYYEMFSRFYKGTGKEFKPYKNN